MVNERIRKLAERAGIWKPTYNHKTWVRGEYISSPGELEKFAELIVKECVGRCEFVANMADITNTGEMARKTKATADSCAIMIKEHFGIKE